MCITWASWNVLVRDVTILLTELGILTATSFNKLYPWYPKGRMVINWNLGIISRSSLGVKSFEQSGISVKCRPFEKHTFGMLFFWESKFYKLHKNFNFHLQKEIFELAQRRMQNSADLEQYFRDLTCVDGGKTIIPTAKTYFNRIDN